MTTLASATHGTTFSLRICEIYPNPRIRNRQSSIVNLQCIVPPCPSIWSPTRSCRTRWSRLRDARTPAEEFRRAARRISVLLATEALRDVPTREVTVQTPLELAPGRQVAGDVVVVPVLRAGLGMLDAVLELVPDARVGHLGLQRDETTAVASQYYAKLPARTGRAASC